MKKKGVLLTLFAMGILLVIGGAFLTFNNRLSHQMEVDVEERMEEFVSPNLISFHLQMNEQIKKVNTFAEILGKTGELGNPDHKILLQAAVENNGLLRCAISFPDGTFITHDDKNEGNVSDNPFFIANMGGEFFISDPRGAVVDETKTVMLFAAPIYDEGQVIGGVIYSYLCEDMDKIFNLRFMKNRGNMVVVKQSGELLIGHSDYVKGQENLLEYLREQCIHKEHKPEDCLQLKGDSGVKTITLRDTEEELFLRYDKVDFNDWYMLSSIPKSLATQSISELTKSQRDLGGVIGVGVLLYCAVVLILWILQTKNVDTMTGLLTQEGFKKSAKKILQGQKEKDSEKTFVMIKLDVKDFKLINRMYNFTVGDKVIKTIAEALKTVIKENNGICARAGTDSFLIFLPYHGAEWLSGKRELFISTFRHMIGEDFCTTVNFPTGQYILTAEDFQKPDMTEILEKVNFAHRAAKQRYDTIIDYEDDIEKEALFAKTIEDRMGNALSDQEFTLYLQPKFSLPEEKICGAEALVRWKIGDKYFMYPTDFIPVLERNGFIVQLDKYMFQCAARQIRHFIELGLEPLPISVNFSRHHLGNEKFVEELCTIADQEKVPRKYLEIELTESAVFGYVEQISLLISRLHKEGFTISMDDFGSGYSCLAQLKDLNVDTLKIDQGFFRNVTDLQRATVVIAGVLRMAQELNIQTVAEGIETKVQVEMLKEMGCDIVQGYYFSKPIPAAELEELLFK